MNRSRTDVGNVQTLRTTQARQRDREVGLIAPARTLALRIPMQVDQKVEIFHALAPFDMSGKAPYHPDKRKPAKEAESLN